MAERTELDLSKFTAKVWWNISKAILQLTVVCLVLIFVITLVARMGWSIIQFTWQLW